MLVANFIIINSDINSIIAKSLKDTEIENAHNQITRLKLEQTHFEQSLKLKEAENQIQLEKLRASNELELEKLKELQKLEIEQTKQKYQIEIEKGKLGVDQLKDENDIIIKIKQAEIMQTEHGKYAYFPESMFNVLKKDLELKLANNADKQKILSQFLQLSLNNGQSYQSGQLAALKAFLQTHLNISFTEQNLDHTFSDINKEPNKIDFAADKVVDDVAKDGQSNDEKTD